jgi:hypothetical protein
MHYKEIYVTRVIRDGSRKVVLLYYSFTEFESILLLTWSMVIAAGLSCTEAEIINVQFR